MPHDSYCLSASCAIEPPPHLTQTPRCLSSLTVGAERTNRAVAELVARFDAPIVHSIDFAALMGGGAASVRRLRD